MHLRAIELAIDSELAAGRHAAVVPTLEALIAEHPWHERFYAQRCWPSTGGGASPRRSSSTGKRARYSSRRSAPSPEPSCGSSRRQSCDRIPPWRRRRRGRSCPGSSRAAPRSSPAASESFAGCASAGRKPARAAWWWRSSGPPGIGKTRLAAELAAELQKAGAAILYASGTGTPQAALEAVPRARLSNAPTLLVLDDASDAPPAVLDAAAELAREEAEARALLLLVLHGDDEGAPAFAALERTAEAPRLSLAPLSAEAAAEIAEVYVPADGVAMPPDTLMAESDGVPLRTHRTASAWAQAQAAERLELNAGRAKVERGDLRTAQAELTGSVTELQVARERTDLYLVEAPLDPSTPEVCPFRGLAPFDAAHAEYFFGRERLVAGLVASLVGSNMLAVVGPSGSGKSSVVRAGLLPALTRGAPRVGAMAPGADSTRRASP